jgi:hypothetical protein
LIFFKAHIREFNFYEHLESKLSNNQNLKTRRRETEMKLQIVLVSLFITASAGCGKLEKDKNEKFDAERRAVDSSMKAETFASMLRNVRFVDGKAWTYFAFPINGDVAQVELFCKQSGFRLPSKEEIVGVQDNTIRHNLFGNIAVNDQPLPKSVFTGICIRD